MSPDRSDCKGVVLTYLHLGSLALCSSEAGADSEVVLTQVTTGGLNLDPCGLDICLYVCLPLACVPCIGG